MEYRHARSWFWAQRLHGLVQPGIIRQLCSCNQPKMWLESYVRCTMGKDAESGSIFGGGPISAYMLTYISYPTFQSLCTTTVDKESAKSTVFFDYTPAGVETWHDKSRRQCYLQVCSLSLLYSFCVYTLHIQYT